MARLQLASLLLLAAVIGSSAETLIILGDSLSDNGNVWQETNHTIPTPAQGYVNGRSTNGQVWNDYIANETGFTIFNTGVPGAQACAPNIANAGLSFFVPYLAQQANYVAGNASMFDSNRAVFIWIGANDLSVLATALANNVYNMTHALNLVQEVADCIKMAAEGLLKYDITRSLTISTVHNVAIQPIWATAINYFGLNAAQGAQLLVNIGTMVRALNDRIFLDTAELANMYRHAKVTTFDMYGFYYSLVTDSVQLGLPNSTGACLEVDPFYTASGDPSNRVLNKCTNPDQHVFWDYSHPTTKTHSLIADRIAYHLATASDLYRNILMQ